MKENKKEEVKGLENDEKWKEIQSSNNSSTKAKNSSENNSNEDQMDIEPNISEEKNSAKILKLREGKKDEYLEILGQNRDLEGIKSEALIDQEVPSIKEPEGDNNTKKKSEAKKSKRIKRKQVFIKKGKNAYAELPKIIPNKIIRTNIISKKMLRIRKHFFPRMTRRKKAKIKKLVNSNTITFNTKPIIIKSNKDLFPVQKFENDIHPLLRDSPKESRDDVLLFEGWFSQVAPNSNRPGSEPILPLNRTEQIVHNNSHSDDTWENNCNQRTYCESKLNPKGI